MTAEQSAELVAVWMGVADRLADALKNATCFTVQGTQNRLDALNAFDEAIGDLIDHWHEGDDPRPLWEFLGWTQEAYAAWVVAHIDGSKGGSDV